MTKAKSGIVLVSVILIIGGSLAAYQRFKAPAPDVVPGAPSPALNVTVIRPEQREIPLSLTAHGSVEAWQEAIIGAEVNGLRLAEVKAQVGDLVRKGQVLAVFDDTNVLTEIAQSRAALAEAEASEAEARLKAGHVQQVAGTGAMSELQVVEYSTAEKIAVAKVQGAKSQLDAELQRQKNTRVLASDDGVISSRSATLGAVASQGQELFRLIRQNRLEWRAEVTTEEMALLKPGQIANVIVVGFPSVIGKVRILSPTVDPQNRHALVYVDLPGAVTHGLRPGMFGQGVFKQGVRRGLSIPQDAICLRDGFSYVFRLEKPTGDQAEVVQIKVQPGRYFGEWVEMVAGVNPNDRLVASGACFLSDGDGVRVVEK